MALQEGDRVAKDGRPGTITGFYSEVGGDAFVDIRLDCGKETYVRLPDYGGRVQRLVREGAA